MLEETIQRCSPVLHWGPLCLCEKAYKGEMQKRQKTREIILGGRRVIRSYKIMRTFTLWLVTDTGDSSKITLHDMIMLWKKNILNV